MNSYIFVQVSIPLLAFLERPAFYDELILLSVKTVDTRVINLPIQRIWLKTSPFCHGSDFFRCRIWLNEIVFAMEGCASAPLFFVLTGIKSYHYTCSLLFSFFKWNHCELFIHCSPFCWSYLTHLCIHIILFISHCDLWAQDAKFWPLLLYANALELKIYDIVCTFLCQIWIMNSMVEWHAFQWPGLPSLGKKKFCCKFVMLIKSLMCLIRIAFFHHSWDQSCYFEISSTELGHQNMEATWVWLTWPICVLPMRAAMLCWLP